ncbi:MAG: hypothetical protein CMQ29_07600 [Gammaproteobacteria bacterium]|nr:hypothetical protein [Gammaproteobacteria bacterium]
MEVNGEAKLVKVGRTFRRLELIAANSREAVVVEGKRRTLNLDGGNGSCIYRFRGCQHPR